MYDIIVIGAGVTGTCTARELSKYQVNMCVIDKGDDVASGTSKANSGIVHGGYDCKPGTLMAEMNVRGNELLYELAEDLDYPIKKNGSLIVCTVPGERGKLDVLLEQAKENGVVIAASYWGKFKTNFQMFAIILLMLNLGENFPAYAGGIHIAEQILIYIALILTIVSLVDYLAKNIDVLKEGGNEK